MALPALNSVQIYQIKAALRACEELHADVLSTLTVMDIGWGENNWVPGTCATYPTGTVCGVYQLQASWRAQHNYQDTYYWTKYALQHGFWQYGGIMAIARANPSYGPGRIANMCQGAFADLNTGANYYGQYDSLAKETVAKYGSSGSGVGALVNPLAHAVITSHDRVDEGVDFGVNGGYLVAMGPGVVTYSSTTPSGWPGEYVCYVLEGVPGMAGAVIYYAEDIGTLAATGTRLKAGDYVCTLGKGGSIEIGFGSTNPPNSWARQNSVHYDYHNSTGAGILFNELLARLGAPTGNVEGHQLGVMPPYDIQAATVGGAAVAVNSQSAVDAILADDWSPWYDYGMAVAYEGAQFGKRYADTTLGNVKGMSVFTTKGGR